MSETRVHEGGAEGRGGGSYLGLHSSRAEAENLKLSWLESQRTELLNGKHLSSYSIKDWLICSDFYLSPYVFLNVLYFINKGQVSEWVRTCASTIVVGVGYRGGAEFYKKRNTSVALHVSLRPAAPPNEIPD